MQKGITAVKFSFNTPERQKEVIIRISKSCKDISYRDKQTSNQFVKRYFTFNKSYRLDALLGFSFGAETFTFKYLQAQMVKKSQGLRINDLELAYMEQILANAESRALYRAPKEMIEDQQLQYDQLTKKIEFFHPWQCISLHLQNSTIDLVIKDKAEMFALINILNVHLYKIPIS